MHAFLIQLKINHLKKRILRERSMTSIHIKASHMDFIAYHKAYNLAFNLTPYAEKQKKPLLY